MFIHLVSILSVLFSLIITRKNNKHHERGHEQLRNAVDIPVAYHARDTCTSGEYIEFMEGNDENPYDKIQETSNVRYNK